MEELRKELTKLLDHPILKIIMQNSKSCILYGGYLRDTVAGLNPADIDISVDKDFVQFCIKKNKNVNNGFDYRYSKKTDLPPYDTYNQLFSGYYEQIVFCSLFLTLYLAFF